MTEPLCAVCGEGLDYEDHQPGSELRHEFEPDRERCATCVVRQRLESHSDGLAATFEALLADQRVRAEKAEADAALAWRRVTELQERGTQLVEERRAAEATCTAERERCAGICDRLAALKEQGAGTIGPVLQLREAARLIRGGDA